MTSIGETVKEILESVPGLVGVAVIDSDGIPIAIEGEIGMESEDLGAMLASAFQCYQALGEGLGKFRCELVMAEFDTMNLAQQTMPRGSLILIAKKEAPLGVIRVSAKTGMEKLAEDMEATADLRKTFMEEHKVSLPTRSVETDGARPVSLLSLLEKKKKG